MQYLSRYTAQSSKHLQNWLSFHQNFEQQMLNLLESRGKFGHHFTNFANFVMAVPRGREAGRADLAEADREPVRKLRVQSEDRRTREAPPLSLLAHICSLHVMACFLTCMRRKRFWSTYIHYIVRHT